MATSILYITFVSSLLLVLSLFAVTTTGLPVGNYSNGFHDNSTANSNNNTMSSPMITQVDCSLPKANTDFNEIRAGHRIIELYLSAVPQASTYCGSPLVINQHSNPSTYYMADPDVNSPSFIAKWYKFFASINAYLSHIQSTTSGQDELNLLATTQSLLTSLEQSYLIVLQDRQCNCSSSSCTISTTLYDINDSLVCSSLVRNVHLFLRHVIPEARRTLNQFKSNCDCQSETTAMTNEEWFENNFPTENTSLYNTVQALL